MYADDYHSECNVLNRTTPKQIEHRDKISEMMEDNPDSSIEVVKQAIAVSWCCDLAQNVEHRHEIPCLFFVLFVMPNSQYVNSFLSY